MNTRISNTLGGTLVACPRHIDEWRRLIVGTTTDTPTDAPCPACEAERHAAEEPARVRAALTSPALAHTRARNHCGAFVCIYHRDEESPTGVMLAAMCPAKMFDEIFAELRAAGQVPAFASPLSPTEGRGR